jgi:hypothetical protein
MKKIIIIIIISIGIQSCGSTGYCTTKSTNRGGGYYINR